MSEAARSESRHRFEALIAARRFALVRSAERILRDPAEAEDVVQETCAAAWRRLDAIEPGALKAYLFRAVELNSLKRRARRRRHLPLDDAGDPPARRHEETTLDPVDLERALDGLGESQKAVLRMKYYAGMTFDEIGRTLAVSKNTAASHCRRAIEAMRKALNAKRQ